MGVLIKPNNKCCSCTHYVEGRCARNSVPRFCGDRYERKAADEGPAANL